MRIAPAVAAVPLLLVLLTFLSMRALNPEAEIFDRALTALDRLAMLEAALDRDTLSARTGILRNYDPLVRQVNALDDVIVRLRSTAMGDREQMAAIDRLAASTDRQEELVEQFKSDNALLQNALTYFQIFCGRLFASTRNGVVGPAVISLSASMLQLTLDTSPAAVSGVEDRLNQLAALPAPPGDEDALQALLAHGRMLRDLLPATDSVLRALFALPMKQDQDSLRHVILARQTASRDLAREFRRLLYGTSLVLLALLVYVGLALRARARALQRRAVFERVLAAISMRFIDARPQDIGAHVELALAQMAECVGADRAYFLICGAPALGSETQIRSWCRHGQSVAPCWPDQVLALMARFEPGLGGIIHIPDARRLPHRADREVLTAVGLRGWACVSTVNSDGVSMILGFDALQQASGITRAGELGLLPTALETIANAIRRQFLERERSRLETRLQQARRMETVGALASGIAHNFNNIVGAILGYAEMAAPYLASDSRPARNLGAIRRAADRARDLVEQILAFGRQRDVRRTPISVEVLIDEAESLLRASLPPTIELIVGDVPETAIVSGEPGQLQQVLLNLCNNAAQSMDGAGRIDIETELRIITRKHSPARCELTPGRYVRIAVSDAGCGMDDATLERIFEPFFTTRRTGNGLGLATVREIVREHDGIVRVWSEPDTGSRFEIWLPCITEVAPVAIRETPRHLPRGNGETVMIVDDESERLLRDEEILAALGYEAVGFLRAEDALAACRAAPARFDVMVVGHLASSEAALELAAALHRIAPEPPILLATASAEEIAADALVAVGIREIVHRPLSIAGIAAALMRCLAPGGNLVPRATDVTQFARAEITS